MVDSFGKGPIRVSTVRTGANFECCWIFLQLRKNKFGQYKVLNSFLDNFVRQTVYSHLLIDFKLLSNCKVMIRLPNQLANIEIIILAIKASKIGTLLESASLVTFLLVLFRLD